VSARTALLALPLALATIRPTPPPRLFALATLPRIRLEAARDHVIVVEEANLPRGDWPGQDFQLYVAFGAPGAPRALDARLYAAGEAGRDPAGDAPFEPIAVDSSPRRPPAAYPFLGSPSMAGVVLHVREAAFRRAVAPFGTARIRIRELYDLPEEDARTGREVVVRLGPRGGEPFALGRIELVSLEQDHWLARAEARLCGPDADPYPLAVSIIPRGPHPPEWPGPASPALSVRHATDDLCVRFWTAGP
jgi:hypothetical protein